MPSTYDIIVIGGGMTGASVAAKVSAERSVLLLEQEEQLGYHSTGRSAALFIPTYGNTQVRALTRASRDFFYDPPPAFCQSALVKPRSLLVTAGLDARRQLDEMLDHVVPEDRFTLKTPAEAVALCPILRPEALSAAALTECVADIEVHELHQGYLRTLKKNGGAIQTEAAVTGLSRDGEVWRITTTKGEFAASIVVNAAGAWADEVARLAGAQRVGLMPLRRTACLIAPPPGSHSETWPMFSDVSDQFYLKPDAGMLLVSPVDETLSLPSDAQPEEIDIAIAIDRIERATTLSVTRVAHKWAGLRSFVEDKSPLIGFDARRPGFFWQAAFGGFGIQTAPAASRLAASLIFGRRPDDALLAAGVDPRALAPSRLPELAA